MHRGINMMRRNKAMNPLRRKAQWITALFICCLVMGAHAANGSDDARIKQLIRKARAQVVKKKLTTPYRDNAYETLQQLKKIDPQNPAIAEITETIKAQYLKWIAASEKKNQTAYARLFCYRYLIVDPNNKEIRNKLNAIDNGQAASGELVKAESSPEDLKKNMVFVSGGVYKMGSNETFPPDRKPLHEVYVSPFYIDKYETTNAEFAAFLNALGNPESAYIKISATPYINQVNGIFTVSKGKEDLPVNFVSWYGADAYCRWRGKRLATEAEWEKAARGPAALKYSWGNSIPNKKNGNFLDTMDWKLVLKPVNTYEANKSPFGAVNMSGSVWEWCSDWYDAMYYRSSPEKDPKGALSGTHRVLRGGQAGTRDLFLETSYRNHNVPGLQSPYTGCRCALSESEK